MKNYFSKIVSRASGITEPASFHPNNQHRFFNNKPVGDLNPFENRDCFTEETLPARTYETPAFQSIKALPVKDDYKNDLPAIHVISNNEKADGTVSEKKNKLTPFSPEENVSNTSSRIKPNTIRAEKHQDEKPIVVKKQSIKKNNKSLEQFQAYNAIEPGKSDSINPNNMFINNSESREKISKEKGKEIIRGIYKSPEETTHPFILKKEVKQATSEQGDNIKPYEKNNQMVSEILPKSPQNKQVPFHFQKKQKERRLIIGTIKVEVVSPQPVKASQAPAQKTHHIIRKQRGQKNNAKNNKLRFGLGQV